MKLISAMLGSIIGTGVSGLSLGRLPHPTHKANAMVRTHRMHGVSPVFEIDHRSLERNKYAPWGRGHNAVAHGAEGAVI